MPLYEFRCIQCGLDEVMNRYYPIGEVIDFPCPVCGGRLKRVLSNFHFKRGMGEHFNPSIGGYVRNERDFLDGLKRKSEEATLRTGMDHNFVPVDLNDRKALGVTDDGMEQIEENNALRERGAAPVHVGETPRDSKTVGAWGTFDPGSAPDAGKREE